MIGTQIAHYTIKALLGEGGMGRVYQALDTRTNTSVAIKSLKQSLIERSPEIVERFQREGEALSQLNHPNIITILDTVQHEGQHYLVMDYIEGGDLRLLIEKEGQLSLNRALQIALDLADALTRAHRLDIIHRDIKPENVLLADDGIPRLTDFGVAHVGGDENITQEGEMVGTFAYLSPEGCAGRLLDERADIWAFGVLIFEMLTGQKPFPGDNIVVVINSIMKDEPQDIQALRKDLPDELVDLIYRMLVKDPELRIPSVRLIGAELEALIKCRSFTPTPTSATVSERASLREDSVFKTPSPDTSPGKHNLQTPATPFVGRKKELEELKTMIANPDVRLVTILGPGGMGKSRLATETGLAHINDFPEGAYFIELAPLVDPNNIPTAIANALGLPLQEGQDQKSQVLNFLVDKKMLLILDNYEHLISAAGLVSEILSTAPHVKVIVTSREKLNLSAENVLAISGLQMPDFDIPEDVVDYDAIQLFLQGASRSKADFTIEHDDLMNVSKICRMVGGMPLGILLATAWVDTLSLGEIVEEMQSSVDFLESESADTPDRHRSMRGVFDYSWKLLTEEERQAYMRMSVFYGGCTRTAAQTISGASIRTLTKLVNKSVLQRDIQTGRFQVHELLRQLAEEHLEASGEAKELQKQHSEYFLTLIASCEEDLKGKNQVEALDHMDVDFENIRAAWLYAVENGRDDLIDQSLESLYLMTRFRGKFNDGLELFEKARAKWPASQESNLAGRLLIRHTDPKAPSVETYRKGLAIAEKHGVQEDILFAKNQLGRVLAHIFEDEPTKEGIPLLEECIEEYRKIGDEFSAARALDDISFAYSFSDLKTKFKYGEESIEIRRRIKDYVGLNNVLLNLSMSYALATDLDKSLAANKEGYKMASFVKDRRYMGWHLLFIAEFEILRGNIDVGEKNMKEVKELVDLVNDHDLTIEYLYQEGLLKLLQGDYQGAKKYHDQAYNIYSESNMHDMSSLTVGIATYVGLEDIDKVLNDFLPVLDNFFKHSPAGNDYVAFSNAPALASLLIHYGEYTLAAKTMGYLDKLSNYLKGHVFQERYPLSRETEALLIEKMGEEAYQAARAEHESISYQDITTKLIELHEKST